MRAATIPSAILTVAALALGACGGDPAEPSTTTIALPPSSTTTSSTTTADPPATPPAAEQPPGPAETAADDPRVNEVERRAARTARAYIEAIDAHDGARVCALLSSGSLGELEAPRPGGSCAATVEASLGYRDPRGLPVWQSSHAVEVRVAELSGDGQFAKVIATVATTYTDRDEESIEDDIIYLTAAGRGWRVAKPSATLYRAFGVADVPPSVLSPPG